MRRNVLLLQGPVGPFFSRFAQALESRGFRVYKVNFNGGDRLFFDTPAAIDFTGEPQDWRTWLKRLVVNRDIGRIYVFGDCRGHHRVAREIANEHGAEFYVFEEGYIRPNFITLEADGVNGHSLMVQRPELARSLRQRREADLASLPIEERAQPSLLFLATALYSAAYYLACRMSRGRYPHYRHHRPLDPVSEGYRWIVSGIRKLRYRLKERRTLDELVAHYENNYFVCPLQVHCDMQVVVHSDYNSIEHFIGDVLLNFARHAPSNKAIVFKHHPLDRGYTDYSWLFASLIGELGLQGRVFYVHDLCLPSLLRHAQGTVLINSTVGISSLFHGTPVKTLGRSVYASMGLASELSLEEFWDTSESVDRTNFLRFRKYLIDTNQINGNFYRALPGCGDAGLNWSARMAEQHTYRIAAAKRSVTAAVGVVGNVGRAANTEGRDDGSAAAA